MKKKFSFLTQHLRDINESYFSHFFHATCFGIRAGAAAIIVIIHAVLPFILVPTAGNIITRLYKNMSIRAKRVMLAHTGDQKIAIIGFGLSGVIAFKNLVEQQSNKKLTIHIYDASPSAPKGIAYSTNLCNCRPWEEMLLMVLPLL
jgi:hypothetical protein